MSYIQRSQRNMLLFVVSLCLGAPAGWAGLNLGMTGAVKRQTEKLDTKVHAINADQRSTALALTGNVVKGPLEGATVTFYKLNADGTKGSVLGTATTDSDGNFSVTLSIRSDDLILAESSGGSYVNEVTGSTDTLTSADLLSTILPATATSGTLTPLTHMAATRARALAAGGIPLRIAIAVAKAGVAQQYQLSDISAVLPGDVTSTTTVATTSFAQREYGLVLGGITQLAQSLNVRPVDLAAAYASDLSDGTLDGKNGSVVITVPVISGGTIPLTAAMGTSDLQTSIDTFVASAKNKTNLTTKKINSTPLTVGSTTTLNPFYVTTTVLPDWTVLQPGTATISAAGGTAPYSCSLAAGSVLPGNFQLTDCTLTGTGPGSMSISTPFTIRVQDSAGHFQDVEYRINTLQAKPQFSLVAEPTMYVHERATVALIDPDSIVATSPIYFKEDLLASGAPPIGTVVDLNGSLTGTPAAVGEYFFGICLVDNIGLSTCKTAAVLVIPAPTLPGGETEFSGSISGSGTSSRSGIGQACTWADTYSGNMTMTISIDGSGNVSGTATADGTVVSVTTAGSCPGGEGALDGTFIVDGTTSNIEWSGIWSFDVGYRGDFVGSLSGKTITGTITSTYLASGGSGGATIPITLTAP